MVAPVTGNNLGMRRAEIKPGVREIHLCKDERGRMGLRLRAIDQVGNAEAAGSRVGDDSGQRLLKPQGPAPLQAADTVGHSLPGAVLIREV